MSTTRSQENQSPQTLIDIDTYVHATDDTTGKALADAGNLVNNAPLSGTWCIIKIPNQKEGDKYIYLSNSTGPYTFNRKNLSDALNKKASVANNEDNKETPIDSKRSEILFSESRRLKVENNAEIKIGQASKNDNGTAGSSATIYNLLRKAPNKDAGQQVAEQKIAAQLAVPLEQQVEILTACKDIRYCDNMAGYLDATKSTPTESLKYQLIITKNPGANLNGKLFIGTYFYSEKNGAIKPSASIEFENADRVIETQEALTLNIPKEEAKTTAVTNTEKTTIPEREAKAGGNVGASAIAAATATVTTTTKLTNLRLTPATTPTTPELIKNTISSKTLSDITVAGGADALLKNADSGTWFIVKKPNQSSDSYVYFCKVADSTNPTKPYRIVEYQIDQKNLLFALEQRKEGFDVTDANNKKIHIENDRNLFSGQKLDVENKIKSIQGPKKGESNTSKGTNDIKKPAIQNPIPNVNRSLEEEKKQLREHETITYSDDKGSYDNFIKAAIDPKNPSLYELIVTANPDSNQPFIGRYCQLEDKTIKLSDPITFANASEVIKEQNRLNKVALNPQPNAAIKKVEAKKTIGKSDTENKPAEIAKEAAENNGAPPTAVAIAHDDSKAIKMEEKIGTENNPTKEIKKNTGNNGASPTAVATAKNDSKPKTIKQRLSNSFSLFAKKITNFRSGDNNAAPSDNKNNQQQHRKNTP